METIFEGRGYRHSLTAGGTLIISAIDKSVRYHGLVHESTYFPGKWTGIIMLSGRESVELDVGHKDRDTAIRHVKKRIVEINDNPASARYHRSELEE